MAPRDLAAVGVRASEKQDRWGALCSSVWPTAELLIALLLGCWLGSQGFPRLGNPFPMASVAHSLLVHNIKGRERYEEADRCPERLVGDGGRPGTIRPQLDLTQVLGFPHSGTLWCASEAWLTLGGFGGWNLRRVRVRGCLMRNEGALNRGIGSPL